MIESTTSHQDFQQRSMTGYALEHPSYRVRGALFRHQDDGRLLSGCGGDIEVIHALEMERSQHTGLPVRVTNVVVFGSNDVVRLIQPIEGTEDVIVNGDYHVSIVQSVELFESSTVSKSRILKLPGKIVAVNAEKHSNTELLLVFLLETGLYHYSFCAQTSEHFQCIQAFRCNRPITSGLLWRDSGLLHVAYYDGFVRVGVVHEQYDDMLLVKRVAVNRNNLAVLLDVVFEEIGRIQKFEDTEKQRRDDMLTTSKSLSEKLVTEEEVVEGDTTNDDFAKLKFEFKNQSIRCERVSTRLTSLRKLISIIKSALDMNDQIEQMIALLVDQLGELEKLEQLCEEVQKTGNQNLIGKSWIAVEEKRMVVDELIAKVNSDQIKKHSDEWDQKIDQIIDQLNGCSEVAKDMRMILSQNIFEHRGDKKDVFTHFILDSQSRDITLYCLSGLTTLAIYPRKGKRVASISLDASFATCLTSACAMKSVEGVYVADQNAVFPIYFYREKRYLDAGNQLQIPAFDSISSILIEPHQMILGSVTGGLLHLSFDFASNFEHFIIASSMLAHPISSGAVNCIKLLATGESLLALHCTDAEVVVSEKDQDRWHRVTHHTGGAHSIAVTPFSVDERGAFAVVASDTFVRLKALQYAEESLIGLHDLGESRAEDENGHPIEVLNVSLDPSMQYRQLPCKLRYAVGFSDKAIRTYVALLTGQHDFTVTEKFIAQIEPLFNVQNMICFHGRPMGCYVSCAKTLQIWNDLDRHQQKKLKSERMQLVKLSSSVTSMERTDGFLLVGFADDRLSIYEEKGNGSVELVGTVEEWHKGLCDRSVLGLRTRASKTSCGTRLFIHSLTGHHIVIHTVLVQASKIEQHDFIVAHEHSMSQPIGFEFVSYKYFEFLVYGRGISNEKLSVEDRKRMDCFRDFEFN
ncbi:CRE-DCT-6 protein [Caenorhabditis remanei]|uniref:CRE-DCT-6 protein n=1 Tax=Caenorhabditis remanei TaxID=31234 RepID=E3LYP8_CAERE|nr:CRE-DCT-6 protein [Caenorhabditis remanei]